MSKKKKQLKKIPKFKNEDEEREFWSAHNIVDYFDESQAIVNPKFPNLKPSTKTISLRLPLSMLNDIKATANKKDVPYQSYIKIILDEKIKQEIDKMHK